MATWLALTTQPPSVVGVKWTENVGTVSIRQTAIRQVVAQTNQTLAPF